MDLDFEYDASGNRIAKKVTDHSSSVVIKTTYYGRDAIGNVGLFRI